MRADNGQVVELRGLIQDITERKQSEAALRDQEEFFRLIAENIDGFIAVLDTQGRRIYNSPSYARLLGDQPLVGTNSFENVHPDDYLRVKQAFNEAVASGVGQPLEYRFLMPDGAIRQMESRGCVIRDEEGRSKRVVIVSNDVTNRHEADQKIHHLAYHDALTQLPNRQTLNDRLQQAMSTSNRNGRYGALMFLDLDDFKSVNDRHGHSAGDQLLIQAAARLTGCVREMDTVARFSGDEFIVLLGELDRDHAPSVTLAERVAEKVRDAISAPFVLATKAADGSLAPIEHQCTASIGVALFRNHEHTEEEILKLADQAMYRAKENGRDKIYFYGHEC